MKWDLEYRNIEVWGTVISIIIPRSEFNEARFDSACASATRYYKEIDERFSTFKDGSEISRLLRGVLEIGEASPDVKLVWNQLRDLYLRWIYQLSCFSVT